MVKIYCDSGADITFLKKYYNKCDFVQYPYDSSYRPKKKNMALATPSALTWSQANTTWGESTFTWGECCGSKQFNKIMEIIGKQNKADILHIDSAYKSGCHIFLTSDKRDIYSKKELLEAICNFRIFYPFEGKVAIIEYIELLQSQFP